MNVNDIYDRLFKPPAGGTVQHAPEPLSEPEYPDFIPVEIQKAMRRTALQDHRRQTEAELARRAEEQRSHMLDAQQYGMGLTQQGIGAGRHVGFDMATQQASTASEMAHRQRAQSAQLRGIVDNVQSAMMSPVWNQKVYGQPVFNQSTEEKDMSSNGTYMNGGIMRIKFPFGEVEMNVSNESELDRAHEMAKHMLKVHEENEATYAIKKDLRSHATAAPMPQDDTGGFIAHESL